MRNNRQIQRTSRDGGNTKPVAVTRQTVEGRAPFLRGLTPCTLAQQIKMDISCLAACRCLSRGCFLCASAQNARLRSILQDPLLRLALQTNLQAVLLICPSGLTALAAEDKSVRLWNAGTGRCVAEFRGHYGGITHLHFSPDSTMVGADEEGAAHTRQGSMLMGS